MAQIYYDPTGGFLYSLDSKGNAEVVKTDPCVFLPENVYVDKQGYIHVKNLQGKDQILTDENGINISIKGPSGIDGRVIHCYEKGDTVFYTKIIENLTPGTYTIHGMVTAPTGTDPFTSACIVVGDPSLPNNGAGKVYTFGQTFTTSNSANVYIAFAHQDYITYLFADPTITDAVDAALSDFDITVENIHVCTHGNDGKDGKDGLDGAPGQPVLIDSSKHDYLTGITTITFTDGNTIDITNGTRFLVPDSTVTDAVLLSSVVPAFNSLVLQHGDYTISYDSQSVWYWDENGGGFAKLFTLKGDKGADGANGINGQDGVDGIDGVDGSPGEGIHVLSESDIVLLSQYMSVTRDAVCQTLIDNIVQAEQIVSAGLYQFITNDYAYPETDPFILDGWLFKVVSTDGVSYVTQYIGQSLIGPQGAKGDQGDSYFTQPVADKLTAIAGEYDNVKQEVDDLRFDYDLLQGDYDSMKDMAQPYIDKFKDLYDTYGDELTPLLQKCKDLFDKYKDEDLSDLLDRCKAKLELLDQIDLSGLAVAYPKDTTPEEA